MIDSSLPDGPWDELELGLEGEVDSSAGAEPWNESDAWIDDEPWSDDAWGEENLCESLTLKYLGPRAFRVA